MSMASTTLPIGIRDQSIRGLTTSQIDEKLRVIFGFGGTASGRTPEEWLEHWTRLFPAFEQEFSRTYRAARERCQREFEVYWSHKDPDLGEAPFEEIPFTVNGADTRGYAFDAARRAWMRARGFKP